MKVKKLRNTICDIVKTSLFVILFLVINNPFQVYGQYAMRVYSSGTVYFENNVTMNNNLTVNGTIYGNHLNLSGTPSFASINVSSINNSFLLPQGYFNPKYNNSGSLGRINQAFNTITAYNIYNLSDMRQKENIRNIGKSLEIVKSLEGVKYDIKKEFSCNDTTKTELENEATRKNNLGFLAQDVNKVLPEVVCYDEKFDIYGLNYSSIIPVLTEAIKDMYAELELLRSSEKSQLNNPNSIDFGSQTLQLSVQNHDSPIDLNIPLNAEHKMFCIYDTKGQQIKQIDIENEGTIQLNINELDLNTGNYFYSLIVDGELLESNKMLITN